MFHTAATQPHVQFNVAVVHATGPAQEQFDRNLRWVHCTKISSLQKAGLRASQVWKHACCQCTSVLSLTYLSTIHSNHTAPGKFLSYYITINLVTIRVQNQLDVCQLAAGKIKENKNRREGGARK